MAQNANENNVLPNKTKIDHYIIDSHIGHGGYGEIYAVYDDHNKGPWAMKVEMKSAKKHGLTEEIHYLKMLRGSPMFPEYICSGETNDLKYFIMELLGPSVSLIRRSLPDLRYTQLTATILAKEMLKCIEELHKRGYVHRDIKPGNFLIRPNRTNPIVLIDFGLSRRFADRETGKPLPPRHNPGFIGTCSFASLNAHEGKELGRRDDIFSWIYTVIEMVDKRLPWPGSKDREKTYRLKQQIRPYDLCRSLPRAFTTIYIKTLDYNFEDKPDYQNFYKMLDKAIQDLGGYGKPFDWERLSPEVITRISAIPLDMGPLNNSSNDEDNNIEEKDNNRKSSRPRKSSSVDPNSKNNENQPKQKNNREKTLIIPNDQKNQELNPRKSKGKSNSIANTTNATNETNESKKHNQPQINKQEETAPEQDDNDVSGYAEKDNDDDDNSHSKLKTAPPGDSQNANKVIQNHKNSDKNENSQNSTSNSRSNSQLKDQDSDQNHKSNSNSGGSFDNRQDSDPQQKGDDKPQTGQVNSKSVNTNSNHETPTEEPQNISRDTKTKKTKKSKKTDEEPGCKACIIS